MDEGIEYRGPDCELEIRMSVPLTQKMREDPRTGQCFLSLVIGDMTIYCDVNGYPWGMSINVPKGWRP